MEAEILGNMLTDDPEFNAMFADEPIPVYVHRVTGEVQTSKEIDDSIYPGSTYDILSASVSPEPEFYAKERSSGSHVETVDDLEAVEPRSSSSRDPIDRSWYILREE